MESRHTGPDGSDAPDLTGLARLAAVDLNLLVPLLALLEERSVTSAAARVGMTQPAMSHALRRMRRLFSDELLVRRGSAMTPTPRGLTLLAPLRNALRETAEIVRPAGFDPTTDRRVVTLAMTSSSARVLIGEVARLLAERAPGVVLRLRTMPLSAPADSVLTDDAVDALLLPQAFATAFPRERVYDDQWVAITNSAAPPLPVMELLETLPHVVFDASPYRARPYEVLSELGLHYTVSARISDNLLIPYVVAAAGGIAFHRQHVATEMSHSLDLVVHELPFAVANLGMDLVWNPWLADDDLRSWLGAIIREAAASTGHTLVADR